MTAFSGRRLICVLFFIPQAPLVSCTLKQLLILSRHGVRGPYGPAGQNLSQTTLQPYHKASTFQFDISATSWGTDIHPLRVVTPKLTQHGKAVITAMGKYMATYEYRHFLGSPRNASVMTCDRKILMAYADHNERDNDTAHAFFQGLMPACDQSHHPIEVSNNGSLGLFQQGETPTQACPLCSRAVFHGLLGTRDARFLIARHRDTIARMNHLLGCCQPSVCTTNNASVLNTSTPCTLSDIPSVWTGSFFAPFTDALSTSEYFSEWFLLQSLNNMTFPAGRTLDEIITLSSLHMAHMELISNEFQSRQFGSTLLTHLVASMEQTVTGRAVKLPPQAEGPYLLQSRKHNRLVYYAGHDINLLFLKNLLRLQWFTKGWQPNQPSPGSMLVFELHQEDAFAPDPVSWYIQLYFMSATPQQIRDAAELTPTHPPERVPVSIPGCSVTVSNETRCAFSVFKTLVAASLNPTCVSPSLVAYAKRLTPREETGVYFSPFFLSVIFMMIVIVLAMALYGLDTSSVKRAQGQQSSEYQAINEEEDEDEVFDF